jgi:hypothetical protein
VQLVTPLGTEVINQLPVAVGAVAPVGPVTVAVKETVDPSDAVGASAETATVGVALFTEVVLPEVGAVAE